MSAQPYRSLSLEDEGDDELLATELDYGRVVATLKDHGADLDEWEAERGTNWRNPVTLKELRDFLGY